MFPQQYWRAEVYTEANEDPGKTVIRKIFAGIYASRKKAEQAAQRKCHRVKGFGFYVHILGDENFTKYNPIM